MKFNSESAKKAGKISKRGRALPMEMRSSLYELVNTILNDLDYESLNASSCFGTKRVIKQLKANVCQMSVSFLLILRVL